MNRGQRLIAKIHLTVTFCCYYSEVFGIVQIMEFLVVSRDGFRALAVRVSIDGTRRAFLAMRARMHRHLVGPT